MEAIANKNNRIAINAKPSMITAIIYIFKRDMKIMFRYPSWFIPMLIWPVIFPLGFIFTAKALSGTSGNSLETFLVHAGTTNFTTYMLIGTTMWMWINIMLWSFGSSLRQEQIRGTLESNWLCPVPKISLLLGYSVSQLVMSLGYIIVAVIEFKLVYNFEIVGSPLLSLLIILLSIPPIYGIGFIFASLVMWAKEANSMVFLVRGIMSIFCGITYPLAVLPNWMASVSNMIPLTYSIRALRAVVLSGANMNDIKTEISALIIFGLILMTTGILAFLFTQKKVRDTGSLGHY
ncbi:ABC transporter permease [Proteiniborus sp. MB09-C3]|uniref:ABC transporter permease n=1 Tax=Proteiniborus sp. MB09-C3 TaxID=3050072 RepID=UPI002553E408|nr:ABC transporter permease [Proteiniborus sp. MB09-C3]WIV11595.1 ABC transporter permease [Proteiniborus sp. MB09-C3]